MPKLNKDHYDVALIDRECSQTLDPFLLYVRVTLNLLELKHNPTKKARKTLDQIVSDMINSHYLTKLAHRNKFACSAIYWNGKKKKNKCSNLWKYNRIWTWISQIQVFFMWSFHPIHVISEFQIEISVPVYSWIILFSIRVSHTCNHNCTSWFTSSHSPKHKHHMI